MIDRPHGPLLLVCLLVACKGREPADPPPAPAIDTPRSAPAGVKVVIDGVTNVGAAGTSGTVSVTGDGPVIEGSGERASETREVGPFRALSVGGPIDVRWSKGAVAKVVVTADDNLLAQIETKVEGDVLVIGLRGSLRAHSSLEATIVSPEVTGVKTDGSGDIDFDGGGTGTFKVELAGSGNVSGSGAGEAIEVVLKGSGNVDLKRFMVDRATVALAGSGNVTVHATEACTVELDGSGDVKVFGHPPKLDKQIHGSGDVETP